MGSMVLWVFWTCRLQGTMGGGGCEWSVPRTLIDWTPAEVVMGVGELNV